jgi:dipeptidyl-peptidase-4
MKRPIVFVLACICLLGAASLVSAADPVPGDWMSYSNPAGFAIRYPSDWMLEEMPDEAGVPYRTAVVGGDEGRVEMRWGSGFGGACPQGAVPVQVAEGELQACYTSTANGTEGWTQMGKALEATSFSADAYAVGQIASSHDLVLRVLSTLSFLPAGPPAGAVTPRTLVQPGALAGAVPSSIAWSPTGATLAFVEGEAGLEKLWLYDPVAGEKRLLLDPTTQDGGLDVSSAQWSPDGKTMLVGGSGGALWLLDVASGKAAKLLTAGASLDAWMFTPTGEAVSWVEGNDLYLIELASGETKRLTTDGGETVFNGALDWVYNEELATRTAQPAYAWSPDGAWLIWLQLDETSVGRDPVTDYGPVPATVSYTRYPTVGTSNPVPTLKAMAMGATAPALTIPLPRNSEYILPYFVWTPDGQQALFMTVNREHTELGLHSWAPLSGEVRELVRETDAAWINEDRVAAPVFLGDGDQFLWLSERDGFMHLYLYGMDGELVRQLTDGEWMIDSSAWNLLTPGRPVHVPPDGEYAYFVSTAAGPLERQLQRVKPDGGEPEVISAEPGFHAHALSADGKWLVDQWSNVDTPPVTLVTPTGGGDSQQLSVAAGPALDLPAVSREFVSIEAADGTELLGQIVKPEGFDPATKYPVVVHWYGGPGLQMVSDRYGRTNIFNILERDALYTQAGYIVWRMDNRGSFGRGHDFETPIFGELGKIALEDQLVGIEYLRGLPYVDAGRIGVDGKSFGGYLTLYALLFAPDTFRCGVAGAPPTDWTTYDTIYTERYMRTPEENREGYSATNLVENAARIIAEPLLIHGLADTNVHLQNTVNFIQALQENDKLFDFVPLPATGHSFKGDALAAALLASVDYFTDCLGSPPAPAAPVESTAGVTAPAWEPLPQATCDALAAQMSSALDTETVQSIEPFTEPGTTRTGTGCQSLVKGTGVEFENPQSALDALAGVLEGQGWAEDPMLASGGATGAGEGYRKGDDICYASAEWQLDAATSCPSDQPISACEVPPEHRDYTVTLICAQPAAPASPATPGSTGRANPASENCTKQGGALKLEARGDGGEYGVCYFEDNRQCEEWALYRSECPTGGVKVTGYVTDLARYCAITGGSYEATSGAGSEQEQGSCTLPGGAVCDAQSYYEGRCNAGAGSPGAGGNQPAPDSTGRANPASENCTKQGGALEIEERGDGGQYGVCYFEDNRQCEEWALYRGDCPVGGVKVTGYDTDAARYCAITGGSYETTSTAGADEAGACTLPSGKLCDAWDYYNGKCGG